jgi:hypothetical protein
MNTSKNANGLRTIFNGAILKIYIENKTNILKIFIL